MFVLFALFAVRWRMGREEEGGRAAQPLIVGPFPRALTDLWQTYLRLWLLLAPQATLRGTTGHWKTLRHMISNHEDAIEMTWFFVLQAAG
jgi:hypothetical protein